MNHQPHCSTPIESNPTAKDAQNQNSRMAAMGSRPRRTRWKSILIPWVQTTLLLTPALNCRALATIDRKTATETAVMTAETPGTTLHETEVEAGHFTIEIGTVAGRGMTTAYTATTFTLGHVVEDFDDHAYSSMSFKVKVACYCLLIWRLAPSCSCTCIKASKILRSQPMRMSH